MSDTPETDAAIKAQSEWKLPFVSYTMDGVTYDGPVATLCRKLERERDQAQYKLEDAIRELNLEKKIAQKACLEIAKLERERDEAQYKLEDARQSLEVALEDLSEAKRERDEAQATLTDIHRWIERNHPDGFIDSLTFTQNLERVGDRWYDRFEQVERERDKARKERDGARQLADAFHQDQTRLLMERRQQA